MKLFWAEMNLLILTPIYPDKERCTSGIFVKEQVHVLKKYHKIIVLHTLVDYNSFSLFPKYSFETIKRDKNLTEIKLTVNKSLPIYNQFNLFIVALWFIKRKILKFHSIDLVHCHITYPSAVIGLLIKQFFKIPYIITEHSNVNFMFRSSFHKFLTLKALRKSNLIIAVSSFLKTVIEAHTKTKVIVVHNFVNTERFVFKPVIFNPGNPKIGFVGSLSGYNKGLDILFKALKINEDANYTLKIGGGGTNFNDFVSLSEDYGIRENCIFFGDINPGEIPEFMAEIDFLVLSSRTETFGIVIIEAMAAGKPVIATNCGGPAEILTPQTGLLVENENYKDLNMAIKNLVENYSFYKPEIIIQYVAKFYSVTVFENKMLKIYSELSLVL